MNVDLDHLLKLRLTVARYGEMDCAGWWNTQGILGRSGSAVLSRGFPVTHWFAQARIACAVASARCEAVFSPPSCFTLWRVPAELEDALSRQWSGWCKSSSTWGSFFDQLAPRNSGDLLKHLQELEIIDAGTVQAVSGLRRSAEGMAVALPGTGNVTPETAMLLAAAFSKGEKHKLAIPYLRADR